MKKILFFILASCCFTASAQRIVQGVLKQPDGKPIINATIHSAQLGTNTATDAMGTFSLAAAVNDTLEIVTTDGIREIYPVNKNTTGTINIMIGKTQSLDEVVVNTGYQRIPKERITGSFTTINKTLLNEQTGTTVLARLESITNGLYVDRSTGGSSGTAGKIVIRGLSTIQGPRAPLIILDDFPYEGDLNNINPNDVENITVLKDASAASIWGSRAGNGVIVITTKKGRFNQKLRVSVGSNVLIANKPDLNYLKQISSEDYVGVERFLFSKNFYNSTLSAGYRPVSSVVELLDQARQGTVSQSDADAQIAVIAQGDLRGDAKRLLYKQGVNTQQYISASGGSSIAAWNLSAGWDRNNDVSYNRYDRYNFKTGMDLMPLQNLTISTGIDYTNSNSQVGRPAYPSLRPTTGNYPVYTSLQNANGDPAALFVSYRSRYTDTTGGGLLNNWNYYPLDDYNHVKNTSRLQGILLNAGAKYLFNNGIGISVKYQYGSQTANNDMLYDGDSYVARNLQNEFAQVDQASGTVNFIVPRGGILDNGVATIKTNNVRGQVDYSHQWKRFRFDGLAGAEYRDVITKGNSFRTYGYNPALGTSTPVDLVSFFPNYVTGDLRPIPDTRFVTEKLNRFISVYANGAVTLDDKYTLSASMRRDASNLFGAKQNDKWTPLWSTGAAWKIDPRYKLRASYGASGNADPSKSAVTTIFYSGVSPVTNEPIARIDQLENNSLSWEKVQMLSIGVDFNLLHNRLTGSVEYYHKKATNLFGITPLDATAGNDFVVKNVASIKGNGLDIAINSRNLTGRISWMTQLNVNINRDKVVRYYLFNKSAALFTSGSNITAVEGRPVYALYTYQWAGLDSTGAPQGYVNGEISKNYTALAGPDVQYSDLKYIGPTLPVVTASLGNTFTWKNISLSVRITGKFGHWFQRTSIDYTDLLNNRIGHPDYVLRWQRPGDELHTSVPAFIYPNNRNRNTFYRNSEILATRADHIRLQYITLSYDVKKPSLQFYINANDLGILWRANKFGIDPEYRNNLPPAANIALGVRANF